MAEWHRSNFFSSADCKPQCHICPTANVALLGEELRVWPPEKRLLALSMAVHCADLGNPGKGLQLSLNWSARITKEFFAQVRQLPRLSSSCGCVHHA